MSTFSTFRPEYFPDLEYFWRLSQCDHAVLTDHIQYTKRSNVSVSAPLSETENRLRIPVRHKPLLQPICEKSVDEHENWRQRHIKTLKHTFNHFPYAYYYIPLMEELYLTLSSNLTDILYKLITSIITWLHMNIRLYRTTEYSVLSDPHDLVELWYEKLDAPNYLVTQQVFDRGWLKREELISRSIPFRMFSEFPEYHIMQTYRYKSILHFLMQFGPEAGYLIRQYR